MREYELSTFWGFPKQSWLSNNERQRLGRMLRKWKKENPKPTLLQEMLIESIVRLHIWEQRLVDNRVTFDNQKTDYQQVADKKTDVDSEYLSQKQKEWEKYMPQIMKWKAEYLKIALANKIEINMDGTVSDLFKALDQTSKAGVSEI